MDRPKKVLIAAGVLLLTVSRVVWAAEGTTIRVRATPDKLSLPEDASATIDVEVLDSEGAPVSGVSLDILARLGRVSRPREIGPGRYTATYRPPEKKYPQLEILAVRAAGHGLGWLSIPLHGTGVLEVKTEPQANVMLLIEGRTFGPVKADDTGKALVNFKAPPGLNEATLITGDGFSEGSQKKVELEVPQVQPVMMVTGSKALAADGMSTTTVDVYLIDRDNRPFSGAPLSFSSDYGTISRPVERKPGWYSALYTAPSSLNDGSARVTVEVKGRGKEYRASCLVALVPGPPVRMSLSVRPGELRADGASRALIEMRVLDAAGNPIHDAAIRVESTAGRVGPVERGEKGVHIAWLQAPTPDQAPTKITVRAVAHAPQSRPVAASTVVRVVTKTQPAVPFYKRLSFYKWAALGAGVAAAAPGAVLLGLDGQETCDGPPEANCPEVYDTLVPGSILVGVGAALLVTSLVLHLIDTGDDPSPSGAAFGFSPGPAGIVVFGSLSF